MYMYTLYIYVQTSQQRIINQTSSFPFLCMIHIYICIVRSTEYLHAICTLYMYVHTYIYYVSVQLNYCNPTRYTYMHQISSRTLLYLATLPLLFLRPLGAPSSFELSSSINAFFGAGVPFTAPSFLNRRTLVRLSSPSCHSKGSR